MLRGPFSLVCCVFLYLYIADEGLYQGHEAFRTNFYIWYCFLCFQVQVWELRDKRMNGWMLEPNGLQYGFSIQISVNLGQTFLRISCLRKITVTLDAGFVYLLSLFSQTLQFIYWTGLIFISIYFEWRDTENHQLYDTKPYYQLIIKITVSEKTEKNSQVMK